MSSYVDYMRIMIEGTLVRIGVQTRDENGMTTTEMAVAIGGLVIIAAAAVVIFMAKMRSNAEAIPDNVAPPG